MDTQRLSAILLIAAFVAAVLSALINAPGLYATQDINVRLEIIGTYKTRWLITQALVGVYVLLTALGFAVLASALRMTGNPWVLALGTTAIVAGTIAGLYFVYLQTIDPRGGYSGAYPAPENLAYWLWLAGTLLFGVAILQAGLPAWLGYMAAGATLVYGIVFIVSGTGFLTPGLVAIFGLVIAIVLLRR
jgi:hypothetical protein